MKEDEDSSAGAESRNVEEGEWMIVVESVEVKVGGDDRRKMEKQTGRLENGGIQCY